MTSPLDCGCPSAIAHNWNSAAYLCREGSPLSDNELDELDEEIWKEDEWDNYFHSWEADGRRSPKQRTRGKYPTRQHFPTPRFVQATNWHLAEAKVLANGFRGRPGKLCPVPYIPEDATPAQQIMALEATGYRVVKQHR